MSIDQHKWPRASPYRDQRKAVIAVAALALLTGIFETFTIVAIVAFIEGVTSGDLQWEVAVGPIDEELGRPELMALAGISLVGMTAGQVLSVWLRGRSAAHWQYKIQMRAMRAHLGASWAAQSSETSGYLQNLMSLCSYTKQGLTGLMTLLTAAGAVLIFSTAAFVASPLAAATLLVTGLVLMLSLRPLRTAAREATRTVANWQGVVAEEVGEIHDLAQEIRVFDADASVERGLRASSTRWMEARQRGAFLTGIGGVLYRSLGLTFILVAAFVASSRTEIDLARVGVAGLLLLRSIGYGQGIQKSWQLMENARPYIEQVDEALETYEESSPREGTRRLDEVGGLELRDVSYSYGNATPALHAIDATIARGETLGIVGPSGSGKSTLAQILLGLREPTSGRYLASGTSVADIRAEDWFRSVTVVPQQPQLLHGTILENIVFYRDWIGIDDSKRAAMAAGLHDEILALPEGYETEIGDAARDLSGGQRQRLGIARALAGSPQLLVLDEPTSALDAVSESQIQRTLALLKGTVTVVIIAHRLSTLNHCDRLLVLERGTVQSLDTPNVVMRQSDFYRTAVAMQSVEPDGAAEGDVGYAVDVVQIDVDTQNTASDMPDPAVERATD